MPELGLLEKIILFQTVVWMKKVMGIESNYSMKGSMASLFIRFEKKVGNVQGLIQHLTCTHVYEMTIVIRAIPTPTLPHMTLIQAKKNSPEHCQSE